MEWITTRRALVLGSGLVVGGLIATNGAARAAGQSGALGATPQGGSELPVTEIESILEANGTVTNGVLSVGIDREDLKAKLVPGNFPVLPALSSTARSTSSPWKAAEPSSMAIFV